MAEICKDVKKYLEEAGYTVEEKAEKSLTATREGKRADWVVEIAPAQKPGQEQINPVDPNDQVWANAHQHQITSNSTTSAEAQAAQIDQHQTIDQKEEKKLPTATIHANTLPDGTDQLVHTDKFATPEVPEEHTLTLTWQPKEEGDKKEEGKEDEKPQAKKPEGKDEKKKAEPKKEEGKKAKKVSGDEGEEGDKKEEKKAHSQTFKFSDFDTFRHIMQEGVLKAMTAEVKGDEEASDDEINDVLLLISQAEHSNDVPFLAEVLLRMRGGKKDS